MTTVSKKQTAPKQQDQDLELADQFQSTEQDLVEAQNQLASLTIASAANPLVEAQLEEKRAELVDKRDELLKRYGSIALTWILRGGKVRMAFPDAPAEKEKAAATTRAGSLPTAASIKSKDNGLEVDIEGTLKTLNQVVPIPETKTVRVERSPEPLRTSRGANLDHESLQDTLVLLGRPPGELTDSETLWDELYRLIDACSPANIAVWTDYPKDVQKALVGMVVSRARHIQDEIPDHLRTADLDAELDRLFSGMTAFSKREQPGFVFGLQRHHHPVGESWASDAFRWWDGLTARLPDPAALNPERAIEALEDCIDEGGTDDDIVTLALAALDAGVTSDDPALVDLLTPHMDKLRKHTKFKRLRKAIREAQEADEAFDAEMAGEAPSLPKNWPFRHKIQGKHVAIVGGDLPDEARHRIQNTFKFASVDWVNTDVPDGLQALPRTIRGGDVDMIIALSRFLATGSDKQSRSAAKGSSVPWVDVAGDYTVKAIREAIEKQMTGN